MRTVALAAIALLCVLATPMLRAPALADANDPAGPNPVTLGEKIFPEEFYPVAADGTVQKFDDLPSGLHGNVNTEEVPYDRLRGEAPRLSEAELADLETFLNTLTDGYQPSPSAKR